RRPAGSTRRLVLSCSCRRGLEEPRIKRIAILFEYATLNGGENSMLAAAEVLRGGDFEFVFLAPTHGRLAEVLRANGYQHLPLELHNATGERTPQDQARALVAGAVTACSPDLLHANSLSMGRLTGAISRDVVIPCVAHLRDIVGLSRAAVDDLSGNRLLLAVSRATRDFHVGQGLDADRVRVLYNGVDCRRFHPRPRTGALMTELGLPDSAFLIANIGQIGLRKGQDVLAEAACLLAAQLPESHYLLIGERNSQKPESVEFEARVIERFHAGGLGDRLRSLGYRDDVPRLLNEIDLLVHCAHQEPLGRVLLEAAASGTPIVATDVGGTREILADGQSARLVPAGNVRALADALAELHDNPGKRQSFATVARQRVSVDFSIEHAAQNLAGVWQEVISSQ
ncbi:MAG: glycosyltransferase family 4 protein, partial [Planctomycetaceae bacterium]